MLQQEALKLQVKQLPSGQFSWNQAYLCVKNYTEQQYTCYHIRDLHSSGENITEMKNRKVKYDVCNFSLKTFMLWKMSGVNVSSVAQVLKIIDFVN